MLDALGGAISATDRFSLAGPRATDPVFAAIEVHRSAWKAFDDALADLCEHQEGSLSCAARHLSHDV